MGTPHASVLPPRRTDSPINAKAKNRVPSHSLPADPDGLALSRGGHVSARTMAISQVYFDEKRLIDPVDQRRGFTDMLKRIEGKGVSRNGRDPKCARASRG
jgi:hypothetical protein